MLCSTGEQHNDLLTSNSRVFTICLIESYACHRASSAKSRRQPTAGGSSDDDPGPSSIGLVDRAVSYSPFACHIPRSTVICSRSFTNLSDTFTSHHSDPSTHTHSIHFSTDIDVTCNDLMPAHDPWTVESRSTTSSIISSTMQRIMEFHKEIVDKPHHARKDQHDDQNKDNSTDNTLRRRPMKSLPRRKPQKRSKCLRIPIFLPLRHPPCHILCRETLPYRHLFASIPSHRSLSPLSSPSPHVSSACRPDLPLRVQHAPAW